MEDVEKNIVSCQVKANKANLQQCVFEASQYLTFFIKTLEKLMKQIFYDFLTINILFFFFQMQLLKCA